MNHTQKDDFNPRNSKMLYDNIWLFLENVTLEMKVYVCIYTYTHTHTYTIGDRVLQPIRLITERRKERKRGREEGKELKNLTNINSELR